MLCHSCQQMQDFLLACPECQQLTCLDCQMVDNVGRFVICDVCADTQTQQGETAGDLLRLNLLDCQAAAALGGHDLAGWELIEENGTTGHQAVCRLCGKTVYASHKIIYSLLADTCPSFPAP